MKSARKKNWQNQKKINKLAKTGKAKLARKKNWQNLKKIKNWQKTGKKFKTSWRQNP